MAIADQQRARGVAWARRFADVAGRALFFVTVATLYYPISRALKAFKVRFLYCAFPGGVGQQVAEIDLLLRSMALGRRPKIRPILLVRPQELANPAVPELWRKKIWVVRSPILRALLAPFERIPDIVTPTSAPFAAAHGAYASVLTAWGDRPPVVDLPAGWREDAQAALERWGMRRGGWFVAVHCREGGYHAASEDTNSFRNADITTYLPAMAEIVARGGFVVRLGDPSMKPLPALDGVYDYALSPERRPHLDIALGATCRFFIGTTSGPTSFAALFNRPAALTNMIPYGMAPGLSPTDVAITKIVKWADGRVLSYEDAFHHRASDWRATSNYDNAQFEIVDNSPDEIRDLVIEMLDRIEGRYRPTAGDVQRQRRFRRLLTPKDYCYGAKAEMCAAFLRKYDGQL